MDYEPDIWFVDAHSERYCGDNYVYLVLHPHWLNLPLFTIFQVRVIKCCHVPSPVQTFAHFFTFPFAKTVNDTRLVFILRQDGTYFLKSTFLGFLSHLVHQVRTIESRLEKETLLNVQSIYDFLFDDLSDCSSQSQNWGIWKIFLDLWQVLILLSELSTPGRHAVNLVYDYMLKHSLMVFSL